jgi:hypothetical protein
MGFRLNDSAAPNAAKSTFRLIDLVTFPTINHSIPSINNTSQLHEQDYTNSDGKYTTNLPPFRRSHATPWHTSS